MAPRRKNMEERLSGERNIWIATVRPDGRPHLVPVWFSWVEKKIYVCTEPGSVKGRNLRINTRVALALEGGTHPVISEGLAQFITIRSAIHEARKHDHTVVKEGLKVRTNTHWSDVDLGVCPFSGTAGRHF